MSVLTLLPSRARRLPQGDTGDIILGWLTKVVGLLSILGVMAFDVISIGAATFQVEDEGQQAAQRAAQSFDVSKDLQIAYERALDGTTVGDTIDPASFAVSPSGTVSLTVQRTSPTLLVEKIAPLRQYASVSRTVSAAPLR